MKALSVLLAVGFSTVAVFASAANPVNFNDTAVGGTSKPADDSRARRVFTPRETKDLVFFNADHSPVGAYASFVYGMDAASGGPISGSPNISASGVILGTLEDGLMPFIDAQSAPKPGFVAKDKVRRTLAACSDAWTAPGFSWTHWSPSWAMQDFDKSSAADKRCFFLPATWMTFKLDNKGGTARKTLVFGLPVAGVKKEFAAGTFTGFTTGPHAFAVVAGSCELWDAAVVKEKLGLENGFALALSAEPGQIRELTVTVAHYDAQPVEEGGKLGNPTLTMLRRYPKDRPNTIGARYYYSTLFGSIDEVVSAAAELYPSAKSRCRELDKQLADSGINDSRQFLAGHSLHSYRFNTFFLRDAKGRLLWGEPEGAFTWINTLDLTADQVFCQLALFPWVTRNILDQFADTYCYRAPLRNPDTGELGDVKVLGFAHDMGRELRYALPGESGYENYYRFSMGQEELQNWIICAGLYWKKTGDKAWIQKRGGLLAECLESMLQRDDADPARRDGITSFTTQPDGWREEITTYDALDHALKSSRNSLYIAVKSWACYLALEDMAKALGDSAGAAMARAQAVRCAQSVTRRWDDGLGCLPSVFGGKNTTRIIPAVEGLAYPAQMGFSEAISPSGPYGAFIRILRKHLDAVLVPGVCLDNKSGAWKLSSTSMNTWQSKVYLSQYVAESVFGMKDDPRVNGPVDKVHATFQVFSPRTAAACWSDQLSSGNGFAIGSLHYPRGVTTVLWWLNPGIKGSAIGADSASPTHIRAGNVEKGFRFPAMWAVNNDYVPDQDHGGVLNCALQRMLLQYEGDKIILLPAWPKDWTASFKLHAPKNTTVEGRVEGGKLMELKVVPESRRKDLDIREAQ
jgi:hypothetical protein